MEAPRQQPRADGWTLTPEALNQIVQMVAILTAGLWAFYTFIDRFCRTKALSSRTAEAGSSSFSRASR